MIDILVNLLFESLFWVGIFILIILIITILKRNSNSKYKNYEDFRDDGF